MRFVRIAMLMTCATLPTILEAADTPASRTALIAAVPGCSSVGTSVHCELAPPTPAPRLQPTRLADNIAPQNSGAQRRSRSRPIRQVAVAKPMDMAPTSAEIEQHIASLVAIADCTGAQSFARSVNANDLAQKTFDSCIGLKAASLPAVSAPVSNSATLPVDMARAGG